MKKIKKKSRGSFQSVSRGCQSCGEKVKVGSEAGFMIFFHVALRQKESAADTSLRIQNK